MTPRLLVTMRTANRAPQPNYVGATVRNLLRQGVAAADVHLVPTDPQIDWLLEELGDVPVTLHCPRARRSANANGLAQVAVLDDVEADWLILLEDDLEFCADPIGSMARWLVDHATRDRLVYRFFALGLLHWESDTSTTVPLWEQRGSQAVALRAADARRFAAWAAAHPVDWRPAGAPFQDRPDDGFDKLIGYWARGESGSRSGGLVSTPFFVRHVGLASSLHRYGVARDALFAGADWTYRSREVVWH